MMDDGGTYAETPRHGLSEAKRDDRGGGRPRVSVLMAAHNAAPFIAAAIDSVLWQTYGDLELIIVDDFSTDGTAEIVRRYSDPRVRLITAHNNLGVVQARNLGFAAATGTYLAIHDADDISHPTRLALQIRHLDNHPSDVLIATDIRQMHPNGALMRTRYHGAVTPQMLQWMLYLGNPIAFSSTLMRMSALRRLPEFLREERRYAEDFDLYARLRNYGGFARLPHPLLVYRVHPASTSARHRAAMVEQCGKVLDDIWPRALFEDQDRPAVAAMVARHLAAGEPPNSVLVLEQLRDTIDALSANFLLNHPHCSGAEIDAVMSYGRALWENTACRALRAGTVRWRSARRLRHANLPRPSLGDFIGIALRAALPTWFHSLLKRGLSPVSQAAACVARPPALYITVVLEGSLLPEARQSAAFALPAQEILDLYGVRPAYLLDRDAAMEPAICRAIRSIQDAGGCITGLWWQPKAPLADLQALLCDATVRIYQPRAAPAEALEAARGAGRLPAEAAGLFGLPLSGAVLAAGAQVLDLSTGAALGEPAAPIAGSLDHAQLGQHVTLSPHAIASETQITLIKHLFAKGETEFHLRLHVGVGGPATRPALDRLRRVCEYFFEDLGGVPGNAVALVGAPEGTIASAEGA